MPPELIKPGKFPRTKYWVHRNRKLRDTMLATFAMVVTVIVVGGVVFVAVL